MDPGRIKCQILKKKVKILIFRTVFHRLTNDIQQSEFFFLVQHRLGRSTVRICPSIHIFEQRRNDKTLESNESTINEKQSIFRKLFEIRSTD